MAEDFSIYDQPSTAVEPATRPKEYYAEMPWKDVLGKARESLLPSAGRSLASIPMALYNYPETGHALKQLGLGGLGAAGLYTETDPTKRAEQQAMLSAMVEPFTSKAGFKKALAEDPYSILTAAATPFGGGLAKGAQLVGEASLLGKGLGAAGKLSRYAMDPTQAVTGVAGDIAGGGLEKIRQMRDISTNVPRYSFEKAAEAGALPTDHLGKAAFNDFAAGRGDAVEFSQRARKATEALKNQAMQDWISSKGEMTGSATQPLSYGKINQAIMDARSELAPKNVALDQGAHSALDEIERNIATRLLNYPKGHDLHKLAAFDKLKQDLWSYAQSQPTEAARNAALKPYHAVKQTIYEAAPEYASLMDKYQAIDDQIQNIQKTLGTGNKTAANAEMAKFIKAQRTPEGRDLIEQLSAHDPLLPYMAAGSTLHSSLASGVPGALEKGSMPLHALNFLAAATMMNPVHAVSALGLAGAQAALQSPSLMGELAYQSGRLGSTKAAKIAKELPKAKAIVHPATINLMRSDPRLMGNVEFAPEETPSESGFDLYDKPARASGGRISRGMTSQMLISAVERAKANGQKATESILDTPDEHVVQALKVANEHI